MKTKIQVTEITQEDLVNLFSTATYGSEWLDIRIKKGTYQATGKVDEEDCREDKWAKVLLAGYPIIARDYNSEGVAYGNVVKHKWDEDAYAMKYTLSLKDFKKGLSKAAEYESKEEKADLKEGEERFVRKCFYDFLTDANDFDITEADCLMQIIMFGELIYG